jgi:hypothetical protein
MLKLFFLAKHASLLCRSLNNAKMFYEFMPQIYTATLEDYATGDNVKKLFSSSLTLMQNKLEGC